MKKILLSALLLIGSGLTAAAQVPTTMTTRFQTVMDSLTTNVQTTSGENMGVSIAMTIPGYGSWQGASGKANATANLTTTMTMGVGSVSKLYTAVILLKMQEQGLLSLDDAISEHITTPIANIDMSATIRQLLKHETGFFDAQRDGEVFWPNVFDDPDHFWTYQEAFTMVEQPHFNVGTAHRYSNTNYVLAALIIENLTGGSFANALQQYIKTPLSLTMTFDAATDTTALNAVQESSSYASGFWWPRLGSVAAASLDRGAASIVATPDDVIKFYQAVFTTPFLSPASKTELMDFEPASGYGLGLMQRYLFDQIGHDGYYIGFKSQVYHDLKSGATFCVIINSDDAEADYFAHLDEVFFTKFPKKAADAGIAGIASPRGTSCSSSISPDATLQNFGSNALTSVTINYQVDNGTVQTHPWTGNLASGEAAQVSLPVITAIEGNHNLKVWTTMPNGVAEGNLYNDSINIEFAIQVQNSALNSFSEDFEGTTTPLKVWNTLNIETAEWGITTLTSATGDGSFVRSNNFNPNIGLESYIDIPKIQLGTGSQQLKFTYAYRTIAGFNDRLEVMVSDDCGATWDTLFNKAGDVLSQGLVGGFELYFPTSTEWHTENISLDAYAGNNVLIRFKTMNDYGNNLYLDDIEIGSTLGTNEFTRNGITVYPNPANDYVTVAGLADGSAVSIYNISGQMLLETVVSGDTKLDISSLPQGMYFINTTKGTAKIIKK